MTIPDTREGWKNAYEEAVALARKAIDSEADALGKLFTAEAEAERLQHHCGKRMNAMEAENKAQSAEIAELRKRVQELE